MPRCPHCDYPVPDDRERVGARCPNCHDPLYEPALRFSRRAREGEASCAAHPGMESVSVCARCNQHLCETCRTRWRNVIICAACVDRALASGELKLPPGYYLKWTGQYEQLAEMLARMKIVVPLTLAIIVLLLFLQFRNAVEVLIILLSIPFALVGSVWLMWLLDYRLSTAVWVGVIALVGLMMVGMFSLLS